LEDGDDFYDTFYRKLFASSEEIAALFEKVDMDRQKTMLRRAIVQLLHCYITHTISDELIQIAKLHAADGINASSAMYDRFVVAMIEAVEEVDPKFTDSVALAWLVVTAPGITVMRFNEKLPGYMM
jgi:hemoglobin-like flavoprotein